MKIRQYSLLALLAVLNASMYTQERSQSTFLHSHDSVRLMKTSVDETPLYKVQIPVEVPSSPEISSLLQMVECPIDNNTGRADISIPIHEIKIGSIRLPITLVYNASGIKVNDVASTVGLGWSLNVGGFVTRQTIGKVDQNYEVAPPYKSKEELQADIDEIDYANQTSFLPMQGILTNIYKIIKEDDPTHMLDMYTDRYVYHFGNHSGVFRRQYGTQEYHTIPYDPIHIVSVSHTGICIIDSSGNTYYFDRSEETASDSQTKDINNISYSSIPDLIYSNTAKTWKLTKILSANKCDSIEIEYINSHWKLFGKSQMLINGYLPFYRSDKGETTYIPPISTEDNCWTMISTIVGEPIKMPTPSNCITISNHSGYSLAISCIKVNGHSIVDFTYSNDRKDLHNMKLNNIDIYLGNLHKKYVFYYSYSGKSDLKSYEKKDVDVGLRLMLDSLKIQGTTENNETYSFKYNPQPLPSCGNGWGWEWNSEDDLFHTDFWGYYNGSANRNNIPNTILSDWIPYEYRANRKPDLKYAQACILEEIHYPTTETIKEIR